MRTKLTVTAFLLTLCVPAFAQAPQSDAPAAAPAAPPAAAAPAATTAAAPAAAAPAAQKLVGLAAWNQIVGNSITGNEDGKTLVEYYLPDGTAKSMTGNEISTGKWAISGEAVCFKYTDDDKPECYRVEVTGTTLTYFDEKGSGSRYDILKGNPKGL
jgi:pyruvate/2-oxoglutarate dehydrogenase complex dihydrolipoamide acyltransferase (E2) component